MKNRNWTALLFAWLSLAFFTTCTPSTDSDIPKIGFVDAFEDNTIEQAKDGFFAALQDKGFSEAQGSLQVIYRNAQGDIPTLTQIVRYFISQQVELIATSPSLSTITALQNTEEIPVFMMVSPTPQLMKVSDQEGNAPGNLFGVAEQLAYIDTSFSIIPKLIQPAGDQLRIGLLYNQSEPQSVDAYNRLNELAQQLNVQLVARPVNTTADVQLVTAALINEQIDAFFANPDNTIFGAFETILKSCNEANVPIFTSEAGLVDRGAVAAFGADIYQWGYQAGEQAAAFLEKGSTEELQWEMVKERKRVYNPAAAERFDVEIPKNYISIKR
jgi:putative ABC transport system substrate-binding protein